MEEKQREQILRKDLDKGMEQNRRMEKNMVLKGSGKNQSGADKGRQRMEPKEEKVELRQNNVI